MKLMMFAALVAAAATPVLAQTMPAPTPAPDPAMAQPAPPAPPADPAMAPPPPPATPMAAPMPADGTYPRCTKTVTDHCTERSNARGERLHSTPRPN